MRGESRYRCEFDVLVDIKDIIITPVYRDATEEEKQAYREMGSPLIPKKVKTSEREQEVIIRKNAIVKRIIPDIRHISLQQAFSPKGRIMKNKFLIEDGGRCYLVKGDYFKFKEYIENLMNLPERHIGFKHVKEE